MAKISTYVINTVPTASDMLIGTDVNSANETKNFLVSDVLALIPIGTGPTGPSGPQGIQGVTGAQGIQGVTGLNGPQGIQGIQGIQGVTGSQGIQGVQGLQGPIGIDGPIGVTGLTGAQGPTGATGAGSTVVGATGPIGPIGVTGPQGVQGLTGSISPAGLNWQGAWSALNTYVIDDAVGFGGASYFCINPVGPSATNPSLDPVNWSLLANQGPTGPQGPIGLTGAASTIAGAQGIQGFTGGAGAQGIQGVPGLTGAQGLTGATGITGPQGAQGPAGIQGAPGLQGAQGPIGLTGLTGAQGIPGTNGVQGTPGVTGATGAQGPIGLTGAPGANTQNNIGRFYQGGWIAAEWVEGTSLTRKVLIVSNPQSVVVRPWTTPPFYTTLVPADNRFNGQPNTAAIVLQSGAGTYAAAYCENLVSGGYTDWYLPSIDELNMVYNATVPITRSMAASGFAPPYFTGNNIWSSTESNQSTAFVRSFSGGQGISVVGKSASYFVLPVRIANI